MLFVVLFYSTSGYNEKTGYNSTATSCNNVMNLCSWTWIATTFWSFQPEAMPPSVLSYNSIPTPLTYNSTPTMSSINNRTPLTSFYITSPLPTCATTSLYNITFPMATCTTTSLYVTSSIVTCTTTSLYVTSPMLTFTTTSMWDWCTWVHFKADWKKAEFVSTAVC